MAAVAAAVGGPGGATAFTLAGGGWPLTGWFEALANLAAIGRVHSIVS